MHTLITAVLAFPTITFLVGLILGNRMAVGRDKRREFNEIAMPLFKKLELGKNKLSNNTYSHHLNKDDFMEVQEHFLFRKKKFIVALNEYMRTYQDKSNVLRTPIGFKLIDAKPIIVAIEGLMKYLKRR